MDVELRNLVIVEGNANAPMFEEIDQFGGGLLVYGCEAVLTDVEARDNRAIFGGGIAAKEEPVTSTAASIKARRIRVRNNSARYRGAGFYASNGMFSSIASSTFRDNVGAIQGGGIFIDGTVVDFELVSSRVFDNSAVEGGGIYSAGREDGMVVGGHNLINCTVAFNTASSLGGGVYLDQSTSVNSNGTARRLFNSIFFENSGNGFANGDNVYNGINPATAFPVEAVSYSHSFLGDAESTSFPVPAGQPIIDASGTSTLTPGWVNPSARNFRLLFGQSVCIDRGRDGNLPPDRADIDEDQDLTETLPREFFMGDEAGTGPFDTTREVFRAGAANNSVPGLISGAGSGPNDFVICDIGAFEYRLYAASGGL